MILRVWQNGSMGVISADTNVLTKAAEKVTLPVISEIESLTPATLEAYYVRHGFVIAKPIASLAPVSSDDPDLKAVKSDVDRKYIVKSVNSLIDGYLNKPIVLDPFGDDDEARATWKKAVEQQLGFDGLKDTYDQGKLRRLWTTAFFATIEILFEMQREDHVPLGLDVEAVHNMLRKYTSRIKATDAGDPYAGMSTEEKVVLAKELTEAGVAVLSSIFPSRKKALEAFGYEPSYEKLLSKAQEIDTGVQ